MQVMKERNKEEKDCVKREEKGENRYILLINVYLVPIGRI